MMALTDEDFERAAATLQCDVAAIRAVAEVESPAGGFWPSGDPVTLFEAHWFSRLTGGRFDRGYPQISAPRWSRELYGKTWTQERSRLELAMALNRTAAVMSASWGRFQILGLNFGVCGFDSALAFSDAMGESEGRQLEAFIAYVLARGLDDEIRDHRWRDFARLYNGPEFSVNRYDVKIATAWRELARAAPR